MNTQNTQATVTKNPRKNYRLIAWAAAVMVATLLTVGQPALDALWGTALIPTAAACQAQSAGGDC